MTSSNINKIVQTNFNLKPWILSKNTNEIVNTCIQNMYKQFPASFRRGIKPARVATIRPENMGPLRTFKNQEREMNNNKMTPRLSAAKKQSKTYAPLSDNNLIKHLKSSQQNNSQISQKLAGVDVTTSKKLLKSPNFKIYKSRRFGSSASSSRSSLYRRYDERRLQRQHYQPQVNYLVRSFHTSQFDGSYAKYLMPARNQLVDSRLRSAQDAIKISTEIQNDLMPIDAHTRERISVKENKKSNINLKKYDRLEAWKHPPSIERFLMDTPKISGRKSKPSRLPRLTAEHRNFIRFNINRVAPLKHPMPPNELFTAKHDRCNTELHEKHRRNRMKKLGLIEPSPPTSATTEAEDNGVENLPQTRQQELQSSTATAAAAAALENLTQTNGGYKFKSKWSPNIISHMEANAVIQNSGQAKSNTVKLKSKSTLTKTPVKSIKIPPANPSKSKNPTKSSIASDLVKQQSCLLTSNPQDSQLCQEVFTPISYTSTGPTAAARTKVVKSGNYDIYRENRANFFRPKKY